MQKQTIFLTDEEIYHLLYKYCNLEGFDFSFKKFKKYCIQRWEKVIVVSFCFQETRYRHKSFRAVFKSYEIEFLLNSEVFLQKNEKKMNREYKKLMIEKNGLDSECAKKIKKKLEEEKYDISINYQNELKSAKYEYESAKEKYDLRVVRAKVDYEEENKRLLKDEKYLFGEKHETQERNREL